MSLPSGFLEDLKSRTSLARVVGRKVVWDARKSNHAKGDLWAACPFHQEKTASFHVDDRQGFYYCFGCHAKGDALKFVQETENVDFMEAVGILAREAGMEVPAFDGPAGDRARAATDRRARLAEVTELAVGHYRGQLRSAAAAPAREYLARRGLGADACARFEIGFAPDQRGGTLSALAAKGVPADLVVAAGLAAKPDDGGAPHDRMRGRIIFPIRDGRGRCIGFGGRAMDPNARAKYLNSPETELFDKGRALYNHAPARQAAGRGQPLVVVEGYMDVIALAMAGFEAVVAPLGTAITEDQIRLLWRIADEPVIALDGDAAGTRAALRLIDRALPLLEAGKSLRFALLPAGRDPDDLIRAGGPSAMQAVLDGAQPMVSLLWQARTAGRSFDSPERRAALDRELRGLVATVRDPSIRHYYGAEIDRLRRTLFGFAPAGNAPQHGRRRGRPSLVLPTTRASRVASSDPGAGESLRAGLVLALLVRYPSLLGRFEARLGRLDLTDPGHLELRSALLRHAGDPGGLAEALEAEIGAAVLERLFTERHIAVLPVLAPGTPPDTAEACLVEELDKLDAERARRHEMEDALVDILEAPDEGLTWRLRQAAEASNQALRAQTEDRIEYDVAENGALVERESREHAQAVFDEAERAIARRKGRRTGPGE